MKEYCTEAIVLDKEDFRELDSRVFFYTKSLGKVVGKATSARKITSKLNAHLEPLNLVQLRLIHKNNFQIIDALTIDRFSTLRHPDRLPQILNLLTFMKEMTFAEHSDHELWSIFKETLYSENITYRPLLRSFGFDPQFALCDTCQKEPHYFIAQDFSFCCQKCLDEANNNKVCLKSYIPLS